MTPAHVVTSRTVPLSALWLEAPNWTNPRQFSGLEDKQISELAESIKEKGISNPFMVQRIIIANGDIVDLVIDGQRRGIAARQVLDADAPIPVVDIEAEACELTPDKGDELLLKALTTLERENLSSFELMEVAVRMKARGKTGEYIAAALGKSPSWVSKFLKAREAAGARLLLQWRKGEITDEQFKELAEVKDPERQADAAKEIARARKDGDKSEARMRSKEVKEIARKDATSTNGVHAANGHANGANLVVIKGGKGRVVKGPQLGLIKDAAGTPAAKPVKPPVPKAPSRMVLEQLVGLSTKRPPVHDYVKGIMDGVRYAIGVVDPSGFAKSWMQYLERVGAPIRGAARSLNDRRPRGLPTDRAAKVAKPRKVKAAAKAKPARVKTARKTASAKDKSKRAKKT